VTRCRAIAAFDQGLGVPTVPGSDGAHLPDDEKAECLGKSAAGFGYPVDIRLLGLVAADAAMRVVHGT